MWFNIRFEATEIEHPLALVLLNIWYDRVHRKEIHKDQGTSFTGVGRTDKSGKN